MVAQYFMAKKSTAAADGKRGAQNNIFCHKNLNDSVLVDKEITALAIAAALAQKCKFTHLVIIQGFTLLRQFKLAGD